MRRNGPMTGGYLSAKRLKIELFTELKRKRLNLEAEESRLAEIKNDIKRVDVDISNVQNAYLKAESEKLRCQKMLDNNRARLNSSNEQLLTLERAKESNANFCQRLSSSVQSMTTKFLALDQELAQVMHFVILIDCFTSFPTLELQEFLPELVPVEREEINRLNNEIHLLKNEFRIVSEERLELEQKKSVIDSKLNNFLLKKKEELVALISGNDNGDSCPINPEAVNEMRADLAKLQREFTSRDLELVNNRSRLHQSLNELKEKKRHLEQAKEKLKEHQGIFNESHVLVSAWTFLESFSKSIFNEMYFRLNLSTKSCLSSKLSCNRS